MAKKQPKRSPATVPDAIPAVEIELFGERHTLKYTFRAYEALGLNPFDVDSIKAYTAKQFTPLELSRQIHAGLLHQYYGRKATRPGQLVPTVEDVMDELDPIIYIELWAKIQIALGVDDDAPKKAPAKGAPAANPPAA